MALTDTAIRTAKPSTKPKKMADERGLYLLLNPNGSRWWRWDYRFAGKRKTLSVGVYPDTGLKEAREKAADARKTLAEGVDPSLARKAAKTASMEANGRTFEAVARTWYALAYKDKSESTKEKTLRRLEKDVFPVLGHLPVSEITAPTIKTLIRSIGQRGALDIAKRVFNYVGRILRYAESEGMIERDPSSAIDLSLVLPNRPVKHHAALTDPLEAGALMRSIGEFQGSFITVCALRLLALTFVRPGELRHAEWAEIDLESATWNIPGPRMKMKEPHIVPLSTQAVAILTELHRLTGQGKYAFPANHTSLRPISENTANMALRRMGYTNEDMTSHGFRAMARTLLAERLGFKPEVIEHQLAHQVPDTLGKAYNRTRFLDERRAMMQAWADYLDKLKEGAEVILFRAGGTA
ncbi:MAG: integrase arm-type DNA-binding domain-containing protein [Betaproteobacteria bacterium]|nr:integrase arm-type DNA-binding domain-containing protein [Betaproteobacteria bacterium]